MRFLDSDFFGFPVFGFELDLSPVRDEGRIFEVRDGIERVEAEAVPGESEFG